MFHSNPFLILPAIIEIGQRKIYSLYHIFIWMNKFIFTDIKRIGLQRSPLFSFYNSRHDFSHTIL